MAPRQIDRLPPHDAEMEAGLLSCLFRDPENVVSACEEAGVTQEWFYDLRHQHLLNAMIALANAGKTIDVITVGSKLRDENELEAVGGYPFLQALDDLVPSPAAYPDYIERLREKWMQRLIVAAGTAAAAESLEGKPPGQTLAGLERTLVKLSSAGDIGRERQICHIMGEVVQDLDDYHRGHAQIMHGALTTGIEYNDKLLGGMGGENGNYIVVSARPGFGKTSLAMQFAMHWALDHVDFVPLKDAAGKMVMEQTEQGERPKLTSSRGVAVGVFSLEMAGKPLVKRMLFQRARADMQRWRTGFATAEDLPPLVAASQEIARAKIFIEDAGGATIDQIKAKARRMFREHNIRAFIIDYIQLLNSGRFRDDRVQELAEISRELAKLANKELQVPFVILAQMNRDYEKDPNRAPRLSDLKDCGSIEQDADQVGFLYTPRKAEDDPQYLNAMNQVYGADWSRRPSRVDLLWAKNRYGPAGKVQLLFQRSCTRFHDYNVWLKDHGQKEPAKGELSLYKEQNRPADPQVDYDFPKARDPDDE